MTRQTIRIHALAPTKPALGDTCNGCGVCCTAEPCPVGVMVSGRRYGACRALLWNDDASRYLCGMVSDPGRFLPWRSAPSSWTTRGVAALSARLISAGKGCDSDAQVMD